MKSIEKKLVLERDVWTLAGPVCLLLTVAISLLKSSTPFSLPLIALIGLLCCWMGKMRGLAVALGLLGGSVVYQSFALTQQGVIWEMGVGLAMSLSFLATALSAEEVNTLYQPRVAAADPTLLEQLGLFKYAEVQAAQQIATLKGEIADQTAIIDSYQKLLAMAREEVLGGQHLIEKERQAELNLRHETQLIIEKLELDLTEAQQALTTAQKALNEQEDVYGREIQAREHSLESLRQELQYSRTLRDQQQRALESATRELAEVQAHKNASSAHDQQVIQELSETNSELKAQFAELQNTLQQLSHAHDKALLKSQESQARLLTLEREIEEEKQSPLSSHAAKENFQLARRNEGLYLQMRAQFDEKTRLLEEARKELFHATEKLQALQLESENALQERTSLEKELENHVQKLERMYQTEILGLQTECAQLESIISQLS